MCIQTCKIKYNTKHNNGVPQWFIVGPNTFFNIHKCMSSSIPNVSTGGSYADDFTVYESWYDV